MVLILLYQTGFAGISVIHYVTAHLRKITCSRKSDKNYYHSFVMDWLVPAQADSDSRLMELWLNGRSRHTQRAYAADVERFRERAGKPLKLVTLADLHSFAQTLETLAPASRYRILSAIKSLLSFGDRVGYLQFDVGRVLRLPPVRNRLAERILPEDERHRMVNLEPEGRNRAITESSLCVRSASE